MERPVDFLEFFHPNGPWILTAIEPDGPGIVTRTFAPDSKDSAEQWIREQNVSRNVYFSVNLPTGPLVKKARQADIVAVPWLHSDIDACVGAPLQDELRRIEHLLTDARPAEVPEPTVIIFSGGGFQAFWKLAEPIEVGNDSQAAQLAVDLNLSIGVCLDGDTVQNLDRIMRLPGTWNFPNEKKRARGREKAMATVKAFRPDNIYSLPNFERLARTRHSKKVKHESGAISALSRWSVPERVLTIIRKGHDPENPKQIDNSRSAWLYDVCCNLVRSGVPDHVIVRVIQDSAYRISESVLEKGHKSGEYARRQVDRAREAVAAEPLILDSREPVCSAWHFLRVVRPTLVHQNDDWLDYNGASYEELEDNTISAELYRFLDGA